MATPELSAEALTGWDAAIAELQEVIDTAVSTSPYVASIEWAISRLKAMRPVEKT